MLHRLAIAGFALAALTPAQIYVVDAANGPGAHFTNLWAAVAAVPDGAVLAVRPGLYAGPTILGKGLTILGETGARLVPVVGVVLRIENLAAAQNVVVRGFQLEPVLNFGAIDLVCQNNLGAVVLDGLVPNLGMYSTRRLFATNCDRLQIVGGACLGGFGFGQPGGAGILMNGGDLRLLGSLQVVGGLGVGSTTGFAVDGAGTVRVDPGVVVHGQVPPFGPSITATTSPQALATVDDPPLGSPVTARLHGPHGHLGLLAVGLPGPSYPVPGLADRLSWDPLSAVTQAFGVPTATAPLTAVLAVPNHPSFVGLQFVWHGLAYDPTAGLQVSNAAFHVVH